MSKDKQILEMTFNLIMATSLGVKDLTKQFDYQTVATDLYELYGWRKASEVAREMVEKLTNFFSNDQITRHCKVDAEYINEQIGRIANELMEGKRC